MRRSVLLLLCLVLLLSGCGASEDFQSAESIPETTAAAGFPDGDPETAACLGSYTAEKATDIPVAWVGDRELTNRELQAWYWAEVGQYRQSGGAGLQDLPLDQQSCPIDSSVATWQQYFLKQALNTWHTAQALQIQGQEEGVPLEEPTYKPVQGNYDKYMTGMPATKYMYGYAKTYTPNTMHQAYLDALPEYLDGVAKELGYVDGAQMAQKALGTDQKRMVDFARNYNLAYMYFTSLSYLVEAGEIWPSLTGEETLVTFRHILCTQEGAYDEACALLERWQTTWKPCESSFANLAYQESDDAGSATKGGLYRRAAGAQLPQELADWCLDPDRRPGDTTVLETSHGAHVVYFLEAEDKAAVEAEQQLLRQLEEGLLLEIREKYPMQVSYRDIVLEEAEGTLGKDAVLYPDLAHERFPEVPLYLQQDYPGVRYGGYALQTNGCGITSFAMLASYMMDEALTPPYMCGRFGQYSLETGTDAGIFHHEGGALGCYLLENTHDWEKAREYVKQGYPAIVLQHKGYWTRGGHYLVLERMDAEGLVQVRDSNIYNYSRIEEGHRLDRFPWKVIYPASSGYWIFAPKDITTPACTRCGTGGGLCESYLCQKCQEAVMRRDVYLNH